MLILCRLVFLRQSWDQSVRIQRKKGSPQMIKVAVFPVHDMLVLVALNLCLNLPFHVGVSNHHLLLLMHLKLLNHYCDKLIVQIGLHLADLFGLSLLARLFDF